MRARALQFSAPHRVEIVQREIREPGPGEIVVRTLYSGISSGTELLVYRGEVDPDLSLDESIVNLSGRFSYPFSYGYSCVGVVEQAADGLAPGALVFAFHPHQDRFVCRIDDAIALSESDARLATMFPLVETALQVALDAGDVLDDVVVVMGLGTVGLLASLILQRSGAHVVGVDPSPARRGLAQDLDVEAVTPEAARGRVAEAGGSHGVPLVVEASGNPDALGSALPLLAHEGTALVASWYGTKPVTLSLGREFHRRRLSIRSSQVSTIPARLMPRWNLERRRAHALRLLNELPVKRLATHEFAFEGAAEAFAALDRGDDALMHVALAYERL